jgi:hypothetical protein
MIQRKATMVLLYLLLGLAVFGLLLLITAVADRA